MMATLDRFGIELPPAPEPRLRRPTPCDNCEARGLGCDPAECKYHGWSGFEPSPVLRAGYYDLIELPSRRHIPAPIAARTLGWPALYELPLSPRVRDEQFFYCGRCQCEVTFYLPGGRTETAMVGGWSFYRCKLHRPISPEENESKEAELRRIYEEGRLGVLQYVISVPRRWR